MTPSARLQAVIDILQGLEATAQPADRFLRDWFRARRYAGSKDRAAISERAYAILRHRSSFAWRMGSGDARALVIASLLAEGLSANAIADLFDGKGYGAAALSQDERRALSSPPQGEPPLCVRGEFPPFLEAELVRAFGPALLDEMTAMQARAPVDLRVNILKASRETVLEALRADGFAVEPTPFAPHGLRFPPGEGSAKLGAMPLFAKGAFEFQDEAAQIAALLCAAKPGMRVLDLAAGAGGKSLALAALMRNMGEIVAHDTNPGRLRALAPRAARAGATIVHPWPERPLGAFDVVLIDSPCSGTGTWRRQPELRWRTTPDGLQALTGLQDELLEQGAALVAAGGRLVYATCSILPGENEDRVARFLSRHAGFAVLSASAVWLEATGTTPPPGMDRFFKATPLQTGTDGFFTAVLQRSR
ncbi:MAG: RsmB/NOP family class I SAM-dependent RNA methyltransferase [Rhizomicrobium sp.]